MGVRTVASCKPKPVWTGDVSRMEERIEEMMFLPSSGGDSVVPHRRSLL